MRNYAGWERVTAFGAIYLFIYLHFIYHWQYIKTKGLKRLKSTIRLYSSTNN